MHAVTNVAAVAVVAGDCTYSAVHGLNTQHVHPVVSQLVKTAFFRYFKVRVQQQQRKKQHNLQQTAVVSAAIDAAVVMAAAMMVVGVQRRWCRNMELIIMQRIRGGSRGLPPWLLKLSIVASFHECNSGDSSCLADSVSSNHR
jgi:large-conductance mechanosensitive channel